MVLHPFLHQSNALQIYFHGLSGQTSPQPRLTLTMSRHSRIWPKHRIHSHHQLRYVGSRDPSVPSLSRDVNGERSLLAVHLGPRIGKWGPSGPASPGTVGLDLTQRTHGRWGNQSLSYVGLLKIFISHFCWKFPVKITDYLKKTQRNSKAHSLLTTVTGHIWFLCVQTQFYFPYSHSK